MNRQEALPANHNQPRMSYRLLPLFTALVITCTSLAAQSGETAQNVAPAKAENKRIVLVAGRPSHASGAHEHNAGVRLFENCLQHVEGIEVVSYYGGWPEKADAFDGADGILLYMDGGGRHPILEGNRLQTIGDLMAKGVGLALFHYATDIAPERGGKEFLNWVGGHYETHFSVNPIWTADITELPNHPVTQGVTPFSIRDELYFNIRFRPKMEGITPILQATPSEETRGGPYVNPKGPYPHIVEAKIQAETFAWAVEREDGGRGFGFTGGHFHENWGNPNFRKTALNALVWIAGGTVPPDGVDCEVSHEDLTKNLDP